MSKSVLYTALTTSTAITAGSVIPLGTTIRRFGCNLEQSTNTIETCGNGYYKVTAVATISSSSTDPITITLQQDGVAVPGSLATATVASATEQTVLTVIGIVRNKCTCNTTLSFVLTGADATIDNMAVIVEKL